MIILANQEANEFGYPSRNTQRNQNQQVQTNQSQPNNAILEGSEFSIFGDYLYWQPYFSNMPWANILNNSQNDPIPPDLVPKKIVEAASTTFSGASGFRLGAGYRNTWHMLGVNAEYTRFHTASTSTTSNDHLHNRVADAQAAKAINTWWTDIADAGSIFSASVTSTLHIDQIDLLFSTVFKPVEWFTIIPGAGARGFISLIKMEMEFLRNTWGVDATTTPPFNTNNTLLEQQFHSIGALFSLRSVFDIGWGLASFIDFDVAFQVGETKDSNYDDRLDPRGSVVQNYIHNTTTIKPLIDCALGLEYTYPDIVKGFGILLQAAYEIHVYPDFYQPVYYLAGNEVFAKVVDYRSDLTIQGLRIRAGINF